MKILLTTAQSVAILLGIGLLGYIFARKGIFTRKVLKAFNTLVLNVALPCMVFSSIFTRFEPDRDIRWWLLPLWWLGYKVFLGLLTFLAELFASREVRREFRLSLLFQNEIFFPLMIIITLFGAKSQLIVKLFLFTVLYALLFYSFYHLFLGRRARKKLDWKKILNPIFIATLLAMIIKLSGIQKALPDFALFMFKTVGDMSIPLFLMVIGGNIYLDIKRKEPVHQGEIAKFVLFKNLLFPLLTFLALYLLKPAGDIAWLIFLQSCVPPLMAVPLVIENAGGNRTAANQFLTFSILASIITIPVMITLFSLVFPLPV